MHHAVLPLLMLVRSFSVNEDNTSRSTRGCTIVFFSSPDSLRVAKMTRLPLLVLASVVLLSFTSVVRGLDNGAGLLPPMGYNTQYDVGCSAGMNENAVKESADALVSMGLAALGYKTVQLGDCWAATTRLPSGSLQADHTTFPSGIASLASEMHAEGLFLGVSTSRGPTTCSGRAGSLGFEEVDASTFVEWGVDSVTETGCNATQVQAQAIVQYQTMRDGLNATGKSVFFAIAEGLEWVAPVGAELANSFLSTPGGYSWSGVLDLFDVVNLNEIWQYTGQSAFNDAGYLLSLNDQGEYALNDNQTRAQMGMMAVLASPMIISASLDHLNDYTLDTLSNVEVIAVNQDPLAIGGKLLWSSSEKLLSEGASQIWARPLVDGSWAVEFINAADEIRDVTCDAECFGAMQVGVQAGWGVKVRDIWNTTDLALLYEPTYTVKGLIPNGGSQLLKFTPQPISNQAQPGPITPGDPNSVITLDPSLQPRNQSTIPGSASRRPRVPSLFVLQALTCYRLCFYWL
jgi:alpha-galactosidase